jgi:Tfp pilus assembly protein PilE
MASFKSNPLFFSSLLVLGALTAGQAWLVFSQRGQLSKVNAEIAQKTATLNNFATQNPFPEQSNLTALEADLEQARKTNAEIREVLRATSDIAANMAAAPVPASSTDAFFDIANFVERIRAAAAAAEVKIDEKNRLGFFTYVNEGPPRDLIASVFTQRQHIEYLLGALLKARPAEILTVQRERPLTAEQQRRIREAHDAGQPTPQFTTGGDNNVDHFTIDARTSSRVPNFVNASAYRLTFRGNTLALRALLNELARFELPVVVRSVEVSPLAASTAAAAPAPAATSLASIFGGSPAAGATPAVVEKPIVEQTDSRFSVTVEFVSLVDKNVAAEATNP